MSEKVATPVQQNPKPPRPDSPPDERFWKRYSKHHEFPLSSAGSLLIHCIVGGAVILLGIAYLRAHDEPLTMDAISVTDGGGGGAPDAQGNGPGNGVPPIAGKEAAEKQNEKIVAAPRPDSKQDLPDPHADPVKLPDSTEARPLEADQGSFKDVSRRSQDLRQKLLEGLKQGKGEGGSGSGGGQGTGIGTGQGPGIGPGNGTVSVRQKRLLRWTLNFTTTTGDDYRRQLISLGAILAVPVPSGGYMVIRDLRRTPVIGKIESEEDVKKLNRIFWQDEKPSSVHALAEVLGIQPLPPSFFAFFPKTLEDELLAKELKYRGLKEEQIHETQFEVRYEHGKYVPVVSEQIPN